MLLSERPNKTYVVIVERYNPKLGIDETSSYTIEAPTLAEAVIYSEPVLQGERLRGKNPARILSIHETKPYPKSFMKATQAIMLDVLKDLSITRPEVASEIDEMCETFKSYAESLDFGEQVKDAGDLLLLIPGLDDVYLSVFDDEDYVEVTHDVRSLGSSVALSTTCGLRNITCDRSASGAEGLAALMCGIRDKMEEIA
jgi:hypothetical protein